MSTSATPPPDAVTKIAVAFFTGFTSLRQLNHFRCSGAIAVSLLGDHSHRIAPSLFQSEIDASHINTLDPCCSAQTILEPAGIFAADLLSNFLAISKAKFWALLPGEEHPIAIPAKTAAAIRVFRFLLIIQSFFQNASA